jgi:hypothetical protein
MATQNPERQAIPCQLEVYFPEFPEIDPHRLARFVNECDPDEADPCAIEITEFFQNAFSYLMTHGPVIAPGHTMGYDEDLSFRFDPPPAELKFPFATDALLLVTRVGEGRIQCSVCTETGVHRFCEFAL